MMRPMLKLSMLLALSVAFTHTVTSFVLPAPAGWRSTAATPTSSRYSSPTCSTSVAGAITRTRPHTTITMKGGSGGGRKKSNKLKETPPLPGAGKGQKAYVRQMKSFNGLKGAGADFVDVYVFDQNPDDDKFIFVGKVAWSSEITVEKALQWHRDLIVDHAKLIEPKIKLPLRIFTAPGNSEVEVARNVHDLTWVLGGKGSVSIEGMRNAEVGYRPELYDAGEKYFYVRKLPDGKCPEPASEIMVEGLDKMTEAGVIPPSSPGSSPGPPAPPAAA